MLSIGRFGTRDLARARPFYDAIAAILGAERVTDTPRVVGYRQPGSSALFLVGTPFAGEATVGNGTQLGFSVATTALVDALHATALAQGGTSEGAPGLRGPAGHGFYACYFRDLDGNKLNAVCWKPEAAG